MGQISRQGTCPGIVLGFFFVVENVWRMSWDSQKRACVLEIRFFRISVCPGILLIILRTLKNYVCSTTVCYFMNCHSYMIN